MRDLIPGLGERRTRDRLDELFNRKTLGSVIFGGHLNKLFERIYNLVALVLVLWVLDVDLARSIAIGLTLLALWLVGAVIVVYLFVKWETVVRTAEDAVEGQSNGTDTQED